MTTCQRSAHAPRRLSFPTYLILGILGVFSSSYESNKIGLFKHLNCTDSLVEIFGQSVSALYGGNALKLTLIQKEITFNCIEYYKTELVFV